MIILPQSRIHNLTARGASQHGNGFAAPLRILLLWTIVLCSPAVAAKRQIVLDSLWVQQGELRLSFHVDDLLDDKAIQGLQRGFTSEISHLVQLWQVKGVISQVMVQLPLIIRVYHDNWSQKFAVISEAESRLTSQIETLRRICTSVQAAAIVPTARIEPDARLFLTVTTTFQPISDETYGELRAWVSGRTSDNSKASLKRGRFFGFLVDLLGFGDRALHFKTDSFVITAEGTLQYVK